MSTLVDTLARCSFSELSARFATGRRLRAVDLVGQRFLGRSLGHGALVERLTWQTFRKEIDDNGDGINVMLPQMWHRPSRPERRHMPFVLKETDDGAVIDYRPTHRVPHPLGLAVDPLRRIDDGEGPMVLLGVTELWLGGMRVRTPTWFALTPDDDIGSGAFRPLA